MGKVFFFVQTFLVQISKFKTGMNTDWFCLRINLSIKTKIETQIEKRSEVLDKYPWIILLVVYAELNRKRRRSSG